MKRVFVAIDIPENIKEELVKIQKQIPEFKGKLTERENLHVTLKFLGEIDETQIKKIKESLGKIKFNKFEVSIEEIGFFDNRKSNKYEQQIIIWVNLTNCERLQSEIDNSLSDLFEKEKRFMSHLTIARVKGINNKNKFLEEIKNIKIKKLKFNVDNFYLKESIPTKNKHIYQNLEKYYLILFYNKIYKLFLFYYDKMKKEVKIICSILLVGIVLTSFVSAFSFSELWGKITGRVVTPICGNGRLEGEEQCDGSNFLEGKIACNDHYSEKPIGIVSCNECQIDGSTCSSCPICSDEEVEEEIVEEEIIEEVEEEIVEEVPENCGNGKLDSGEICDGDKIISNFMCGTWVPDKPLGIASCKSDCTIDISSCEKIANNYCRGHNEACFDNSECCSGTCRRPFIFFAKRCTQPLPNCGNGKIDSGEQCDGNDLNYYTCHNQGYDGGTIACTEKCRIDLSGCYDDEEEETTTCGEGEYYSGGQCYEYTTPDDCGPNQRYDGALEECIDLPSDEEEEPNLTNYSAEPDPECFYDQSGQLVCPN